MLPAGKEIWNTDTVGVTPVLSDPETLEISWVGIVVVNEFECASLLYPQTENKTNHLPFLRLHDHSGERGAPSEFRIGRHQQADNLF